MRSANRSFSTRSNVVIVGAARTPMGGFNGSLSSVKATDLGAAAARAAISRAKIDVNEIDEAIFGNVVSSGLGQAPARQAALAAGLPFGVTCTTINKVCSSGLKAAMYASQSIMLNQTKSALVGGFESMSQAPFMLPKARQGLGYGNQTLEDSIVKDGLTDAFDKHLMGICAEDCAAELGFTRQQVDDHAIESYRRAAEAWKAGRYAAEVVPFEIETKKGKVTVSEDEEYTKIKLDKVRTLRPAFKADGVVTAANSPGLSDGGAALVLVSEEYAASRGLKPLARILGFADAEQKPLKFPTAPALAIPRALKNAGVDAKDVDYYEINEAFSVVALANMKLLNLDPTRVNINGGAVAMGHPIGCSGARILVTLLHVLQQKEGSIGVAGICNGGGGASALVIQRM